MHLHFQYNIGVIVSFSMCYFRNIYYSSVIMAKHPWLEHMNKTRKEHPDVKDVGTLAKLAKKTYKSEKKGGSCHDGSSDVIVGGRRRKHRKTRKGGMRGGDNQDQTDAGVGTQGMDEIDLPPADETPEDAVEAENNDEDVVDATSMEDATEGTDAPMMEGGRRRRRRSAKKSHKKGHKKAGSRRHKKAGTRRHKKAGSRRLRRGGRKTRRH